MKIHIFGRDIEKIKDLKNKLNKFDVSYSEDDPDFVICYGGDGTFLIAERVFPNIPKILVKGSEISNKGHDKKVGDIVKSYLKKQYNIERIKKLKATAKVGLEMRELIGVSDIVVRNSLPTEAIRFNIKIGDRIFEKLIGDGVVVSTPYGSEGYFHSITRESFEEGIGVAFNNTTKHFQPLLLNGDEEIEIEVLRGPGVLVADNNRDFVNLEKGDKIYIKQIKDIAKRVVLEWITLKLK